MDAITNKVRTYRNNEPIKITRHKLIRIETMCMFCLWICHLTKDVLSHFVQMNNVEIGANIKAFYILFTKFMAFSRWQTTMPCLPHAYARFHMHGKYVRKPVGFYHFDAKYFGQNCVQKYFYLINNVNQYAGQSSQVWSLYDHILHASPHSKSIIYTNLFIPPRFECRELANMSGMPCAQCSLTNSWKNIYGRANKRLLSKNEIIILCLQLERVAKYFECSWFFSYVGYFQVRSTCLGLAKCHFFHYFLFSLILFLFMFLIFERWEFLEYTFTISIRPVKYIESTAVRWFRAVKWFHNTYCAKNWTQLRETVQETSPSEIPSWKLKRKRKQKNTHTNLNKNRIIAREWQTPPCYVIQMNQNSE